jgi:hypothetical protein
MMETHLPGKITLKRQNFDLSKAPASAESHHFKLNKETRRAARPPDTHFRWLGKMRTR